MSAKITLLPIIRSISGRLGNLYFRTSRAGKTTVSTFNPKNRITPPTKAEINARNLFAKRVTEVNQLIRKYPDITRKEAWKIVKSNNHNIQ